MIESVKITHPEHPLLPKMMHTYKSSFPVNERRKFGEVKKLLSENPRLTIEAFHEGHDYVGFITSWQLDDFVYVEHFAIEETVRNRKIGSRVLTKFVTEKEMPVVLEVEVPEDEMSRRRIGFYQRIGFELDTRLSVHPPYREGVGVLNLHVMAYGDKELATRFHKIKADLVNYVY